MVLFSLLFIYLHKLISSPPNASHTTFIGFTYLTSLIIYGWIFGLIAFLLAKKEHVKLPILNKPNRYLLFSTLFPLALVLISITISFIIKDHQIDTLMNTYLSKLLFFQSMLINKIVILSIAILLNIVNSLITAFCIILGTELMWHGYMLNKLKEQGFWPASFIVGILFGLWNIAHTFFGDTSHLYSKIIGIFIICMLISPLLTYIRIKSKSILVPAILYSLFSSFSSICEMIFSPYHLSLFSITGLFGIIILIFVNLYLYKKKLNNFLQENI
jgi:hypothetical protein